MENIKTVIGDMPMDAGTMETSIKLKSINDLTEMQMKAMDLLWQLSFSAISAPAHGKTRRHSVPSRLIDDAKLLVERYKAEAKRWTADKGEELRVV